MAHDTYCILTVTKHAFSGKFDFTVDLGQQNAAAVYTDALKEYTSEVDALNYMSSQGWELVNSYVNPTLYQMRHTLKKKSTL